MLDRLLERWMREIARPKVDTSIRRSRSRQQLQAAAVARRRSRNRVANKRARAARRVNRGNR